MILSHNAIRLWNYRGKKDKAQAAWNWNCICHTLQLWGCVMVPTAKHHCHLECCKEISVQFSHSVAPDSLRPCGLQHARAACPSPTPWVYSNSCPSSRWSLPAISSSVVPFSSHLQSFPASGSFPMSQSFTSGGQSIAASASTSVLPMNLQDGSPLGLTGLISLQSKGLSRVFSNTTVQKHQFFSIQLSL